ncbi:MAG: FAD/NAD(P)-binding protein [Armatimonadota bacterium]
MALPLPQVDIYVPELATVLQTEMMTAQDRYFRVRLDSGEELGQMPGQFVQISIPGIGEAPISISSSPDLPGFEMVVRNVGRVSAAMHALRDGAKLGVRGPFGSSFPVHDDLKGKDLLFICGGIGLAPLRSAIQYVLNRREGYGKVNILYGTRAPSERLFTSELEQWKAREDITYLETVDRADKAWEGHVGVITTLLPQVAMETAKMRAIICGPPIMYKFVIRELMTLGIPTDHIYISLERRMKCGVGKCGHCQINGIYTCLDGPVFKYAAVADVPEAI